MCWITVSRYSKVLLSALTTHFLFASARSLLFWDWKEEVEVSCLILRSAFNCFSAMHLHLLLRVLIYCSEWWLKSSRGKYTAQTANFILSQASLMSVGSKKRNHKKETEFWIYIKKINNSLNVEHCFFWNEVSYSSNVPLLQNPTPPKPPWPSHVSLRHSCSLPTSFARLSETEGLGGCLWVTLLGSLAISTGFLVTSLCH